jgi:hypothetical protein
MHNILIILPGTTYILLILIFVLRLGFKHFLEAFIYAHLVIFAFISVSTEALSLIQAISFPGLLTAWLLYLIVCFAIAIILFQRRNHSLKLPVLHEFPPLTAFIVGAIIVILVTTLITAILYPPNNWDSMIYHMSRVFQWISNNNISFYPTGITRQNYMMPLAEFGIMHLFNG